MTRTTVHLLRHGQVDNPDGILYGTLPGYHLSDLGRQMAELTARSLRSQDITALVSSPLERAQETAAPIASYFGLTPRLDERVIEARNAFAGKKFTAARLAEPAMWWHLRNPLTPSWGEPYQQVATRMLAAVAQARAEARGHEALIVSHQLPIWTVRRLLQHKPLPHDPRRRECNLASLTSLDFDGDRLVGVRYSEPAAELYPQVTV